MLSHSPCNGSPLEVDPSKPAKTINGEVWYPIRCSNCHHRLGLLPEVDDTEVVETSLSAKELGEAINDYRN